MAEDKSAIETAAGAAHTVKSAVKVGKAVSAAAKGAAAGPHGAVLGFAWENRRAIIKIAISAAASDEKIMDSLYGDDETTSDNLIFSAKYYKNRKPVLTAVTNLYLKKQILFESRGQEMLAGLKEIVLNVCFE